MDTRNKTKFSWILMKVVSINIILWLHLNVYIMLIEMDDIYLYHYSFPISFWHLREASLFLPWGGGRHPPEILITLANHLICAKDFLRVPLFYPRIPKNRRLKIFRPPFGTRWKFFAPPPSGRVEKFLPPPLCGPLKNFCPPPLT